MNPFPEDHELLSIFESGPDVLDADVPWFYNTLTFRGKRDGLDYLIRIRPSNGELEIMMGNPSHPIAHLSISEVSSLRLHAGKGEAVLMASFDPGSGRGVLKIRLFPHLGIEWPFEPT